MIAPIRMRSGITLDLAHPDPELLRVDDLAYHLAGINRWTGASRFTVAQHQVLTFWLTAGGPGHHPGAGEPWAALHDTAEALVGDVGHWLKQLLGEAYRAIERPWIKAVSKRFGVPVADVHRADKLAAQLEARALWPHLSTHGLEPIDPTLVWDQMGHSGLEPWEPKRAEQAWLNLLERLGIQR